VGDQMEQPKPDIGGMLLSWNQSKTALVFTSFVCLQIWFVILVKRKLGKKTACKMLVKLPTGSRFRARSRWSRQPATTTSTWPITSHRIRHIQDSWLRFQPQLLGLNRGEISIYQFIFNSFPVKQTLRSFEIASNILLDIEYLHI